MAVQQIGLDYSWLVDLARMAEENRRYAEEKKATPQATAIKEAGAEGAGSGALAAAGKGEKT